MNVARRLVLASLAIAFLWASPAAAGPARDLVADLAKQATPLINDKTITNAERAEALQALVAKVIDRESMAKSLLGRYWRRASADQKTELVPLLEDYLVDVYAGRVDSIDGELSIKVEDERATGDRWLVDSQVVRPNAPPVQVTWQVEEADGRKIVTDIQVEGVSLIVSQRADFASVIRQQGGIDGLIAQLKKRAK